MQQIKKPKKEIEKCGSELISSVKWKLERRKFEMPGYSQILENKSSQIKNEDLFVDINNQSALKYQEVPLKGEDFYMKQRSGSDSGFP